jgi:hypothetical protein
MYKFGSVTPSGLTDSPFKAELDALVRDANSALILSWAPEDDEGFLKWLKLEGCVTETVSRETSNDFSPAFEYEVVLWRPAFFADEDFERKAKDVWVAATKAVVVEVPRTHSAIPRMVEMGFKFGYLTDGVTAIGFKRK